MGEMEWGPSVSDYVYMHSMIELSQKIMLGGATVPNREAVMTAAAQEVVRLVQRLLVQHG